jgi:hypothetical protein
MRQRLAALEPLLVYLIVAHTVGVGAMLLFAPAWSCTVFGGWSGLGPLFFPRQSGIFHMVAAFAYIYEYRRWGGVTIMVAAKSMAVVFLLACTALDSVPWVVPFSAVTDGLMGLTVVLVRRARKAVES